MPPHGPEERDVEPMGDERPANWSPKFADRRRIWEQNPGLAGTVHST